MSNEPNRRPQASQKDLGLTIERPTGILSAAKFKKLPTDPPMKKASTANIGSCLPEDEADVDD